MPPENTPNVAAQATTEADASQEQPNYVTADQIGNIVNAAVSSHLKRSLDKSIAAALEGALAPIRSKLETPAPTAEDKKSTAPEVTALQKQLADMQAAMRNAQEEARQERQRAREEKAYSALRSELSGKVRPEALDVVADLLMHARKRINVDEDGNVTFNVRTSLGKGLPEEDHAYPLVDGVREYLKTKEAAMFVPPPAAQPAAAKQMAPRAATPQYAPGASLQLTEEEKARRALEALMAQGLNLP